MGLIEVGSPPPRPSTLVAVRGGSRKKAGNARASPSIVCRMAAQLPPPLESEYIFERRLGSGNFGSVQLYKRNRGGIMVAVKLLERGEKINRDVVREVLNHRQ